MNEQTSESSSTEGLRIPPARRRARLLRAIAFGGLLASAAAATYLIRPKPAVELYRTVPLVRRSIVRLVDATGHIGVTGRVEVAAPFSGRLVQILVAPRAQVRKGQLLAKLDDRTQRLAVSQAQASQRAAAERLTEARVAYNAALEEQQHSERLAQRGLASQQDAGNAKTVADRAEAALAAAQAEESVASGSVASAALGHHSTDIIAPADGIVLKAPETLGMMVNPERGALFVIGASLQVLRIDALVNETDIAQVRVGQATHFEVQGLPGQTFDARVERIALEPEIESGVVSYPVTLSANNADGVLLPGMTALVHLEVARVEHVLAVLDAALRFSPNDAPPAPARTRLWRRTGPARAEPVRIRAGLSDGTFTEITAAEGESLQEGDPIVIGLFRPDQTDAGKPSITLGTKP